MKKLIIFLICLFGVVGCACSNDKAADAVEKYLNDYKGLSDDVLKDIDDLVAKENLIKEHQDIYKDILKKQYRDITYTIENENYNGDTANVTVKITVYDLHKVEKDSRKYLNENQSEFLTNGEYDANKYLKYKLEQMKNMKETISYNVVFKTTKTDGKWIVEQPSDEVLEKIHGIYNYDND